MKLKAIRATLASVDPAAFRRLCVETLDFKIARAQPWPAAFRRLCVETLGWI